MGGFGSGREGNRIAVEACLRLDVNHLLRQGLLRTGVHARSRPWFLCPNCDRRAGKLYLPLGGRHFLCRRCYDLGYESQAEEPWWRAERRARKLWQRLGGDPDDAFIPPRPKGVHRRTYERLIAEAERAENLAGAGFAAAVSRRFGGRLG